MDPGNSRLFHDCKHTGGVPFLGIFMSIEMHFQDRIDLQFPDHSSTETLLINV